MRAGDQNNSLLSEVDKDGVNRVAHTAYGHASAEQPIKSRLRFNGEFSEPQTGWQLLGNGYRAYSAILRRFLGADSESPFGKGGVNAYSYVSGNPVKYTDPTGHWMQNLQSFKFKMPPIPRLQSTRGGVTRVSGAQRSQTAEDRMQSWAQSEGIKRSPATAESLYIDQSRRGKMELPTDVNVKPAAISAPGKSARGSSSATSAYSQQRQSRQRPHRDLLEDPYSGGERLVNALKGGVLSDAGRSFFKGLMKEDKPDLGMVTRVRNNQPD